MSRSARLLLPMLLAALPASARPWKGLTPSVSFAQDVIDRFGEPSKRIKTTGQEVLMYSGIKAIEGTVQAQFKCSLETHVLERIDVYPQAPIARDEIESAYGKSCPQTQAREPCYYRKQAPSGRVYFLYLSLGLAVFFKEDGQTVQSLAFLPGA